MFAFLKAVYTICYVANRLLCLPHLPKYGKYNQAYVNSFT
jgi:hypothetical protein